MSDSPKILRAILTDGPAQPEQQSTQARDADLQVTPQAGVTPNNEVWPGCTDIRVHVVMGQSLAAGRGAIKALTKTKVAPGRATMFRVDDYDPLLNGAEIELPAATFDDIDDLVVRGRESPLLAAAQRLVAALPETSALHGFSIARDGYGYSHLKKAGLTSIYQNFTNALSRVVKAAAPRPVSGITVSWIHGQGDSHDTEAAYMAKLIELQTDLTHGYQSLTGMSDQVLMAITQVTPPNHKLRLGVAKGQLAAALAKPDCMILVGPIYALNRSDGTHLTSYTTRQLGAHHGLALQRTLANQHWLPLHMQAARQTAATLQVTFAGGLGELTLDTDLVRPMPDFGFQWLQNGGTPQTISSVAITGARHVTITLSGDPGPCAGSTLTLALNATGRSRAEGFVKADPTNALGAASNIRTHSPETDPGGTPLHDWACHQAIVVTSPI
jgi:hypothetical protein